ncbi:hypothetical protein EXIGLDRAFT_746760 [Exidia glandulosa HHB12029]|uniref:F-box domain-containing protein n=1 Tax=Exidia glandulosa HHB12029 TaxID=1314781 RepID=A0A166B5P1_EXIGL|nr:hypothetical protein EXIGLDRAFT_746760 [Exidia glandulosa HHB12029]
MRAFLFFFLSLLATLCAGRLVQTDMPSCARSCLAPSAVRSSIGANGHCQLHFSQFPAIFKQCLKSGISTLIFKCSDGEISTAVHTLINGCGLENSEKSVNEGSPQQAFWDLLPEFSCCETPSQGVRGAVMVNVSCASHCPRGQCHGHGGLAVTAPICHTPREEVTFWNRALLALRQVVLTGACIMLLNARDAYKSQIREDTAAKAALDHRHIELRRRKSEAQVALTAAQALLDQVTVQEEHLLAQTHTLDASIASARAALVRDLLSTFPDDLLRCVFDDVVGDPLDPMWPPSGCAPYESDRAARPFLLASVSTRWRKVALETPALWSYVGTGLTTDRRVSRRAGDRIKLHLKRSKAAPLDIFIEWDDRTNAVSPDDHTTMGGILSLFEGARSRWRRFDISVSSSMDDSCIDMFKGPTPALRRFAINTYGGDWSDAPEEGYLPFAPNLAHLELSDCGMSIAPTHRGFGRLRSLALWDTDAKNIYRLISLHKDHLESLCLGVNVIEDMPTTEVLMPRLVSLSLAIAPCFLTHWTPQPILHAPSLSSLTLQGPPITAELSPLLERLSPTVTSLTLEDSAFDATHLHILQNLRNISRLTFSKDPGGTSDGYRVQERFFTELADVLPCIWPKLTCVMLPPCGTVDDSQSEALRRFITTRTILVQNGGEEQPCRLREVVLDYFDAPSWLVTDVACLLEMGCPSTAAEITDFGSCAPPFHVLLSLSVYVMVLNARDAYRAQIREETDAIASLASQQSDLRRRRSDAEAALAGAQAILDQVAAQEDRVTAQEQLLKSSVASARAALVRDLLSTFPDDVLRCIFDEVVEQPDPAQWTQKGNDEYDSMTASRPFLLAGVCARWRRVALDTPTLWSYIGAEMTSYRRMPPSSLERIQLLLKRSKAALVDIIVSWYGGNISDDDARLMERILRAIEQSRSRWRTCELTISSTQHVSYFDMLRGPTPSLRRLAIYVSGDTWALEPRDAYLPFAPLLQRLDLDKTGIAVAPTHGGFSSLRSLRIAGETDCGNVSRLISLQREHLEFLCLDVEFDDAPTSALSMRCLKTLSLISKPFFASQTTPPMLNAPNLKELTLEASAIMDTLDPLIRHISHTVVSLTLAYSAFTAAHVHILKELRNVSSLRFDSTDEWKDPYAVEGGFFVELADALPCIWPKLSTLTLPISGSVNDTEIDGLIRFITKRTVALAQTYPPTDGLEQPCRLRDIKVEFYDAPLWLVADVERLLGTSSP